MRKLIDLTGVQFGNLTVIERIENKRSGASRWLCKCRCGAIRKVDGENLRNGISKSCGNCSRNGCVRNLSKTRIHRIWSDMKRRCTNPKRQFYYRYGGRGIRVCKEWEDSFLAFYDWSMANRYSDSLSIDRINNDGNYEPSNCRWVTSRDQFFNKSDTIPSIIYNQRTQTLKEWASELNVSYHTLFSRYQRGWQTEKILFGKHFDCYEKAGERN